MRRRLIALMLVASGAALSLGAVTGYVTAHSQLAERVLHADPHEGAAARGEPSTTPADPAAALTTISAYAAGVPEQPPPVVAYQGLWIEIPSLKIALPIREGDGGDRIPQWVALHYPGTATPGAPGNSYLYAHGLWGMFGGLLFARVGDQVSLHDYTTGTVRQMRVSRVVGRTKWNDMSWIHQHSPSAMLTLQTCIDLDPRGDRFIVEVT